MSRTQLPPSQRAQRAFAAARLGACLGVGVLLGVAMPAQTAKPETSEKTSEELEKFKKAFETNNFDEAGRIIDGVLARVDRKTYDFALSSQFKAQVHLRKGEYVQAIEPLEASIASGFFEGPAVQEMMFILSSLYLQEYNTAKDAAVQKKALERAFHHITTFLSQAPEPPATALDRYTEAVTIYANILFYQAKYPEAIEQVKRAMRLNIDPKDSLYTLLYASYAQSEKFLDAAETLELMLKKNPGKKDLYGQLAQAYLYQARSVTVAKLAPGQIDPANQFYVRAINTYHRAQEQGTLNTPKDYDILFGFYYNMQEYGRAAQLLETWLRSGKIENTEKNWELLGYCYQLLHREDQVVRVLTEGSGRFPKSGNLDFNLAQFLWYDGKYDEGLATAQKAWNKGNLDKKARAAFFIATCAFEQRQYDLSRKFLAIAETFPENAKDVVRLKTLFSTMDQEEAEKKRLAEEREKRIERKAGRT